MACGRKESEEPVHGGEGHASPPVAGDNQGLEAASAARRTANVTVKARGSSQERR